MNAQKKYAFKNATDIYRGTPITLSSPEHVLQAGLGCDLEAVGLIDHTTNTDFGSTIDKSLVEALSLFRAQIGLLNRRGQPILVESADGEFDLRGDYPVQKKDASKGRPWTVTPRPDGRVEIRVRATNLERAAELARHALRAERLEGKSPVEVKAGITQTFPPPTSVNIELGGGLHFRAVAKSCVNALAVCLGPERVASGPFDAIREYVLYGVDNFNDLAQGKPDPQSNLCCFDFRNYLFPALPAGIGFGGLDHRVLLRGCGETGVVYGTCELFGHVPFSVLLSDSWVGDDFCWGLIADPLPDGQGHVVGHLPLEMRPSLAASQVMAHASDLNGYGVSLRGLLSAVKEVVNGRIINEIVSQVAEETFGTTTDQPVTRQLLNTAASRVAALFVQQMHRVDSESPVEVPSVLFPPADAKAREADHTGRSPS